LPLPFTPFTPKPADRTLALETHGGSAKFSSRVVHELGSAWQAAHLGK
jgi:hypothetical protein